MRPSGVYDVNYQQDMSIYRTRVDWFWGLLIAVIILLIPLFSREGIVDLGISPAFIGILTNIWIYIIIVTGLNLLLGYTGQISLGHAAFVMVGAYASQVLVDQWGVTFWLAMPLAALFTGLVGLLFGIPSLRVRGFYLAMATLAAQFMLPWFVKSYSGSWFEGGFWGSLGPISEVLRDINLGGATGRTVSAPELFGYSFTSNFSMYYLCFFTLVILAWAARNIIRSRIGRALISVRDNDLAAEQLGINVFRYKLLAFFIAAIYAGVAGSLLAHSAQSISPDRFNLQDSITYLGMLIIGGLGFPLGPTFGVIFFFLMNDYILPMIRPFLRETLPDILTFITPINLEAALLPIMFGLTLIIFLIFEPRGLAHRWAILQASWRLRPFSQA